MASGDGAPIKGQSLVVALRWGLCEVAPAGQPQGIARTIHDETLTAPLKFDNALRWVDVRLHLLVGIIMSAVLSFRLPSVRIIRGDLSTLLCSVWSQKEAA
jgi:hypothetical protein